MKAKLLTIICVIALIFGVVAVGCAGEEAPPAEQEEEEEEEEEEEVFDLTFGTWDPPEIAMYRVVFSSWEKWLEEQSNGRLKITVLYSETVAKGTELHDACAAGLCDMACAAPGMIPERYRVSEITTLPMLFRYPGSLTSALTATEMYKKYGSYIDAEWDGVKIVGYHTNGASQVCTKPRPVYVLEDFEGLILNTPNPGYPEALGYTPESLSAGESYDALAKGVIDGQIIEYEGDYVHQSYDLNKYHTEVGMNVMALFTSMMNLDVWNSLPADLQALFEGDNFDMHTYINGYNFDIDDALCKEIIYEYWLAQGVENGGIYILPDEERDRWVDTLLPLRDAWVEDAEARGAPGRDMLDDVVMWADEYYLPGDELCPWCEDWFIEWYGEGYTELTPAG